eukprot:TRINITY_DN12981_c0_g1_i1.p1 TRINITY_DN12981_c0_g1~~TRINITY_DN12981_c0_g1_i1.p1  ORF type:complete len:223 (-),score=54.89 TRINITY_DN12981_c0_g1_i1:91-699(-)
MSFARKTLGAELKAKKELQKSPRTSSVTMEELMRLIEERAHGEALEDMPRGRLERLYAAALKSGREAQQDGSFRSWQSEDVPDIETVLAALEDAEDRFRWKPPPKPPEAVRQYLEVKIEDDALYRVALSEEATDKVEGEDDALYEASLCEEGPDEAPVNMEHSEAVVVERSEPAEPQGQQPPKELRPPDLETLKRIVHARRG